MVIYGGLVELEILRALRAGIDPYFLWWECVEEGRWRGLAAVREGGGFWSATVVFGMEVVRVGSLDGGLVAAEWRVRKAEEGLHWAGRSVGGVTHWSGIVMDVDGDPLSFSPDSSWDKGSGGRGAVVGRAG